jgi:hypothetical protein
MGKTNEHLTLDASTLLGGTAGIFDSYVKTTKLYGTDASLIWVTADTSTFFAEGTVV